MNPPLKVDGVSARRRSGTWTQPLGTLVLSLLSLGMGVAPAVAKPKLPVVASPLPVAEVPAMTTPMSLEQATAGLPGTGPLQAELELFSDSKPLGTIHCQLLSDKAPLAVAQFVGLARGVRPWKEPRSQKWVQRPLYENNLVHRVIAGQLLQAGDPLCTGDASCSGMAGGGEPGFAIPDELRPELRFDRPGVLAWANRGPGTSGSQFVITEKELPWLDGRHTIFGLCQDQALIEQVTHVEFTARDMPKVAIVIKRINITRQGAGAATARGPRAKK